MPRKKPVIPILLALSAMALSCCTFFRLVRSTKIKTPSFTYQTCRFLGASDRQTDLEIKLASFNPNTIGLRNVTVSYELFYEDKRFLHGGDIALELKPQDTTRILVPASVVYREVFDAAGPVAQRLLLNRKSIPVRIDAVISGTPTVYNEVEEGALFAFSLKVSRTEDIPIPEESVDKAKRAVRGALKKLF
jgi:hypothetical protein